MSIFPQTVPADRAEGEANQPPVSANSPYAKNFTDESLTGWFPEDVTPVRNGFYMTKRGDVIGFSHWNGRRWGLQYIEPHTHVVEFLVGIRRQTWRALTEDAFLCLAGFHGHVAMLANYAGMSIGKTYYFRGGYENMTAPEQAEFDAVVKLVKASRTNELLGRA